MPLGTEVGLGQSDIVLDEDFFGEDPNFRAVNSNGLTHRHEIWHDNAYWPS